MFQLLVLVALSQAGTIEPVGDAKSVKWAGKQVGYTVQPPDGVALKVVGPTAVLLEVRAKAADKGKDAAIEILRDDAFLSRNKLALKAKPAGGPKTHPLHGQLSWQVPEGAHTYKITSGELALTVALQTAATVDSAALAAAEEQVKPLFAAPDAAALADSSASAAKNVAESLGGSGAPPAAAVQRAIRVAVYDFELAGVDPSIGAVVTDSTLAEVRKLQRISAIGMDEIRDMLSHEANKQYLGCEENEACLAEIAGALGVDELVSGKLSRVDESHVLTIRRIDQNRAKVMGTVDKRLKAESGQEFLAAIGPSIEELFPEFPVREGLTRGVPKEVALRLDPPPLPRWAFWSAAGAAVAAVAAGGVFGYLANESEREWNDQFNTEGSVNGATLKQIEDRADSRAGAANTLFISSGVIAAAAGVMALFTDWEGYGDASRPSQAGAQ